MSVNEFETNLIELIEERENVLFEIERVLFTKRYHLSKKHLDIFTVQSIAMIYSIWEGFIQQSFQLYIAYLNELQVDLNYFADSIVTFHMENKFKQLREYPKKDSSKKNFFLALEEHLSHSYHEIYKVVDTESNVSFEVLNKLLDTFGLEKFPPYWKQYTHPNPSLKDTMGTFLRYRNGVAHGGDISSEEKVSKQVYTKYKCLVTDLMYEMHDKFMKGIAQRTYLRENQRD